MYLKAIKANGFKSFADKTHIILDDNITCIVGPNGSGKSNIVDAARWVLGEQSVKSLRGTNNMSDIIFAGSKSRNGAPRAEVSLLFDNADHYLNSEFKEIEVKRVLYQNGEGEYFINNSRVRLKDITDLFLDSGAGIDSFNIISQGSIESVVNSKPIDRRIIFEEAAGVLKYKKRKAESVRKLEKTKENISKVQLIINELETTLSPLKEHSENAKKYLDLKEKLKNIEIASITHDIGNINLEYEKLQAEVADCNETLTVMGASSSDEVAKLETLKLKSLKLDEKINEVNAKLLKVTSQFVNLQNEKLLYTERKKYEVQQKDMDQNIVILKEEILKFDQDIQRINNEIQTVNKEMKKIDDDLRELDENICYLKVKKNASYKKYQDNMKEFYGLNSQEEVLENAILNDEKMPNAVKSVLNNDRIKGVIQTIGKLIEVPEEYTMAIDTALGASANFIVVEEEGVAKNAITYLKENHLGRATFLPLNIIKSKQINMEDQKLVRASQGFIGIASDLVTYDKKYENIIQNQLGNILVVDTIDSLNQIGKKLSYKYRIVSLEGDILHTGGSLTGGYKKNTNSLLQDKRELERIRKEKERLEQDLQKFQKESKEFEEEERLLREKEEQMHRTQIQLKEEVNEKAKTVEFKKQKQLELNKELDGTLALKEGCIDDKLMVLLQEVNEAETSKLILEKNLEEMKNEKSDVQTEIEQLEHTYREKNGQYNKIQNDLKNKEIQLGKLDIQLDTLLKTLNETYNLTYEKAKNTYILDGDSIEARQKVKMLKNDISKLGEVNVFAIEEYERVSTRYTFLQNQKEDLEQASLNLKNVIEEMDSIMIDKFKTTFTKISEEFKVVFKKLFKGGNGLLKLTEPENILETGIEIIAEPPGKKLNSIGLLSGGEKTLTAISLLFAVLNVKTVPFCILDEVEAALDEANVDAFGKYLQEQKENSQFILITHKKRTMEYADTLYGITMQESGVSKIVSVKLENI